MAGRDECFQWQVQSVQPRWSVDASGGPHRQGSDDGFRFEFSSVDVSRDADFADFFDLFEITVRAADPQGDIALFETDAGPEGTGRTSDGNPLSEAGGTIWIPFSDFGTDAVFDAVEGIHIRIRTGSEGNPEYELDRISTAPTPEPTVGTLIFLAGLDIFLSRRRLRISR
jgi:hypothetical protein